MDVAKDLIPGSSPGINLTTADIPRGKELPRELIEQGTPSEIVPLLHWTHEKLVLEVIALHNRFDKWERIMETLSERINANVS